jgi:hypothetical protein
MTARLGCALAWRFAITTKMAAEQYGTIGLRPVKSLIPRRKNMFGNLSGGAV